MNTFKHKKEYIDANLICRILKSARKQTSDIIIIPRLLNNSNFEIAGIQSRTLIVLSDFSEFKDLYFTPLWEDESLSYIALYSKDIPAYIKTIQDNTLDTLYFDIHEYIVNGYPVSIARSLTSDKLVLLSVPQNEESVLAHPTLSLLPYQEYLDKIQLMKLRFNISNIVNEEEINMKEHDGFKNVWEGLASDGAKLWLPDISTYSEILRPYILYLAKCMFSFSKADQVYLQIRDNIPNERSDMFIARFKIIRKKGKDISIHEYYTNGFKL